MQHRRNFRKPQRPKLHGKMQSGIVVYVDEKLPIDRAIRGFKKKVQNAGIIQEVREREYFTKPSTKKREKKKAARRRWLREQAKINPGKRLY